MSGVVCGRCHGEKVVRSAGNNTPRTCPSCAGEGFISEHEASHTPEQLRVLELRHELDQLRARVTRLRQALECAGERIGKFVAVASAEKVAPVGALVGAIQDLNEIRAVLREEEELQRG